MVSKPFEDKVSSAIFFYTVLKQYARRNLTNVRPKLFLVSEVTINGLKATMNVKCDVKTLLLKLLLYRCFGSFPLCVNNAVEHFQTFLYYIKSISYV